MKPQANQRLIESLEEVMQSSKHAEGLTVTEMCAITGHRSDWVHQRLSRLKAEGKLEVARAPREAIDGSSRLVPVYRIKKP